MDLVNSQQEYDFSSLLTTTDAQTIARTRPLTIMGVEVLDNTGIWHPLYPVSFQSIRETGIALLEYLKTDGRPIQYEKREHSVLVYPSPDNGVNVTLSAGLKIFYLRTANIYTSTEQTTGTREPAFPSPWHDALAYAVAHIVDLPNRPAMAAIYETKRDQKEKELLSFISRRNQDDRPIMTMKHEPHF